MLIVLAISSPKKRWAIIKKLSYYKVLGVFMPLNHAEKSFRDTLIENQTHTTMILRGALNEGHDPSNIIARVITRYIKTMS